MDNENNSKLGSRSENRGKKRKANRIYNILLAIVIVAIIAVAIPIFTNNDDDQSNATNDTASSQNKTADNEKSNTETDSSKTEDSEEQKEDTSEEAVEEEPAEEEEKKENTVVENSGDSNVSETYVNDSWEPVGTTQTGEHVTSYSQGSVDWQEMTQALALGSGLSADNMTVWYIGNGGASNKAIGTVSAKDAGAQAYRVYIEWVDGQGWKPVKVELLKQNDKR